MTFVIPMVLSVENYGYFKLYQFYLTYIGASHLGFCDGVYLMYGGKSISHVKSEEVSKEHKTLFIYELVVSGILLIIGVIKLDYILCMLAFTNVPVIFFGYYNFMLQAIGDFDEYSKNQFSAVVINLILIGIFIFLQEDNFKLYIFLYCIGQYISFLIALFRFKKKGWLHGSKASLSTLLFYIKAGILLLAGNFVYNLFVGIDKWFIKANLSITDFSMYSFAGQLLSAINMCITPISLVLYNRLCKEKNEKFEIQIEKLLFAILMFTLCFVFVLELIVEWILEEYMESLQVFAILYVAHIFISINMALFVNLFKSYKKQKEYFLRMVIALAIAIVLNLIMIMFDPSIVSFAITTLIASLIWFALNCSYFTHLTPKHNLLLFITELMAVFWGLQSIGNEIIGVLVYIVVYIVSLRFMMKEVWEYCIEQLQLYVQKIFG